jgi:hypothetical protein
MYWNTSEHWHRHHHRHHGNGWLVAVVIIGLIILTHGWIIIAPLMLLAALACVAFFGFALPRILCAANRGEWRNTDWADAWHEKRKRYFEGWDEKPKRDNSDDIEYV